MRVTVRLLVAIWLSALVVTVAFTLFQIREERQRILSDLERRAALLGEGLKESIGPAVARGSTRTVERLLKKFGTANRHIAVYDKFAGLLVATPDVPHTVSQSLPEIAEAITDGTVRKGVRTVGDRNTYVYVTPLEREDQPAGAVAVFLDAEHLDDVGVQLWRDNAFRFLVLALLISLITVLVVRITVTRPIARMAEWTKALKTGSVGQPPTVADASLFGALAVEVSGLARSLSRARAAAEQEAALRLRGETLWTEERLKQFVNLRLGGRPLVVVSNREPFRHVWNGREVRVETPASGLVTAMDPVMRACGGIWVAHGSGDADSHTADAKGRLAVPPGDPRYTLKRVSLTKEEEEGYYYGFANEGLWPLCHIVHTRPLFRPEDWGHYVRVNRKFADAVLEELEGTEAPMVLSQDYHFALLPTLIKDARPDARVAIFWHIPWPNFEAFGICPWQDEILQGMLGADLIGFHTQYHCNNFLETVERALEARVDWEHFSVVRGRRVTYVKPFPISVTPEFAEPAQALSRGALLDSLGVAAEFLGVGVERVDYTKGLPERLRALHWFFERYPEYRERLVFVQLGAPSRTRIPRYQELHEEVERTIRDVNQSLQTKRWRPIVYLNRHYEHGEIWPYYRHADFCMVTSLHDGMNLVAKEFVSVRDDEDGVLVLSRFTGASRELRDALLVNPYDLDEMAEAIHAALTMPPEERRSRMARMRESVRERNIYRWAGLLLGELARIADEVTGARVS